MMAPEYIQQVNNDQATKAKFYGWEPEVVAEPSIAESLRSIKHLGDYVPEGWEHEETYFVDSSGFGEVGEAALTFDQFIDIVRDSPESGWAIIEAGQFQVRIGQFSKT